MDFNEDFDFEPAEDLNKSVIDSELENKEVTKNIQNSEKKLNTDEILNNFKEAKLEEEKKLDEDLRKEFNNISKLNNIFDNSKVVNNTTKNASKEEDTADFTYEFNKLKTEKDILNMNSELNIPIKRKSFIEKYAVVLPIFAFVLTLFMGLYLFISNTNANETNLIKIEENKKIGYVDTDGNVIVRAKYISGSDYYKGLAIVKNQNNLSAIIDNKGNMKANFGNYFYIERFSENYIVSKFTNEGLKLGLLDSSLHEITKFKYDNISYAKSGTFVFLRNDIMGILNQNGKEIYTFAVDETDDKDISVEVSKTPSNVKEKYAKIKVNNSSTIINLLTGKEIYKYTLEEINVLENNIFYIKSEKANDKYIVIKDDKIKFETSNYKLVRIEDYDSDILVCLKNDMNYDYINLNNRKIINNNANINYYYSDGLILENKHDFDNNTDKYWIKNTKRTLSEFENIKLVDNKIINGMLKIYTQNNKFNYINTSGKIINEQEYDKVSNFDEFGYAVVSKNNLYGVIDKNGKEVIPIKYENIKTINEDLFKNLKNKFNKELFIYSSGNKDGIISSKNDIIVKATYDSFKFVSTKYPIIVGILDDNKNVINLDLEKEFNIKINKDIEVYDNYFLIDNKYYNYNGNLLYKIKED